MGHLLSILLPGLDGTGDLFEPFVAAAPAAFPLRPVRLPRDRPRGYHELARWLEAQLPSEPMALIAESFSGPLALLIADRCPRVTAVVPCASFVKPPLPSVLAHIPRALLGRTPPSAVLRTLLTGGDRALAEGVRCALQQVDGDIVAKRISEALTVDVSDELRRYPRPILCLRAKQDRIVSARSAEYIRVSRPTAEFVELDGPHLLLQANPAGVWTHAGPSLSAAGGSCRTAPRFRGTSSESSPGRSWGLSASAALSAIVHRLNFSRAPYRKPKTSNFCPNQVCG